MKKSIFLTIALICIFIRPALALASEANEEGKFLQIKASEFKYSPNHIKLERGKRVTVMITNEGKNDHEFLSEILDSMDVDVEMNGVNVGGEIEEIEIEPGKSVKLSFVPNKRGVYKFYCEIKNHESMMGTFEVK